MSHARHIQRTFHCQVLVNTLINYRLDTFFYVQCKILKVSNIDLKLIFQSFTMSDKNNKRLYHKKRLHYIFHDDVGY